MPSVLTTKRAERFSLSLSLNHYFVAIAVRVARHWRVPNPLYKSAPLSLDQHQSISFHNPFPLSNQWHNHHQAPPLTPHWLNQSGSPSFTQSSTGSSSDSSNSASSTPKLRPFSRSSMENVGNDTALSRDDVETVMRRIGTYSHEGERLDERMGFDEMAEIFAEKEPCPEEVKETFCVFDESGDGFIDATELQRMLEKPGLIEEGLAVESCERMIPVYDENRDGRIDFKEFVKMVERSFS